MDDYLSYFLSLPNLTPLTLLALFFLVLFRLAPLIVIAPFLGGKLLPGSIKTGIAIVLAVVFMPLVVAHSSNYPAFDALYLALAFKELIVGFILAFIVSIPFFIVQSSGIIIDFLRGSSMMQMQDPALQAQASPIGILYNFLLIYMFYQIDGPALFFDAISNSYKAFPADTFFHPHFFSMKMPLWKTVVTLMHSIMAISIQFAAPAIVAILMTELFLGIANRLAPQVQIAFLGMSLKSLIGMTILWAGFFFLMQQFSGEIRRWMQVLNALIGSFSL